AAPRRMTPSLPDPIIDGRPPRATAKLRCIGRGFTRSRVQEPGAALHEESGVLRGLRGAAWATRIGSAPRLAGPCRELDWVLVLRGGGREFVSALLPPPRQLADFRRVLRREVSRLGAVGGEVVQLPGPVAAGGHELPVPHADGTVALVLPPQVVMPYRAV